MLTSGAQFPRPYVLPLRADRCSLIYRASGTTTQDVGVKRRRSCGVSLPHGAESRRESGGMRRNDISAMQCDFYIAITPAALLASVQAHFEYRARTVRLLRDHQDGGYDFSGVRFFVGSFYKNSGSRTIWWNITQQVVQNSETKRSRALFGETTRAKNKA